MSSRPHLKSLILQHCRRLGLCSGKTPASLLGLLESRARGKIHSQNSCRKGTLRIPSPKAPLGSLLFPHHPQTRVAVLKALSGPRPGHAVPGTRKGRASWGPVRSGPRSPPLSPQGSFLPTFHLPPPTSSHPQITNTSTRAVCSQPLSLYTSRD